MMRSCSSCFPFLCSLGVPDWPFREVAVHHIRVTFVYFYNLVKSKLVCLPVGVEIASVLDSKSVGYIDVLNVTVTRCYDIPGTTTSILIGPTE